MTSGHAAFGLASSYVSSRSVSVTRYMCTSQEFFNGEPIGLFVLYAVHKSQAAIQRAANRYLYGRE